MWIAHLTLLIDEGYLVRFQHYSTDEVNFLTTECTEDMFWHTIKKVVLSETVLVDAIEL